MKLFTRRRAALVTIVAALAVGLALPTAAATAAPATGQGWVRLGHFSPDTKKVDVRLTALRGGSVVLDLAGVGYGDISGYQNLAEGTYTVAMVPAGSNSWNTPVISSQITVGSGSAATVAAYGPNSGLQVRAFTDDLTQPAAGKARIRLIQASTVTPTVDVTSTTGVSIAKGATQGSSTSYTDVDAGSWTFQLTGSGVSDTATVNAEAGTISTLFVLDTADGGLTILPVLDSAATPVTPDGGVQTGGGWLATHGATAGAGADVWTDIGLFARLFA